MQEDFIEFILSVPSCLLNQDYETRGEIKQELTEIRLRIHSNEIGKHNRQHVHVEFKKNDFVCSIDSKIQIIEPKNCSNSIAKKIERIVAYNLSKCRKEWNKCKTLVKFTDKEINFDKITFNYCDDGINVNI